MPINYSKWDALELSDDSDIEVHPNVDKRSFIRAKQNQIHQQRHDRRFRITTLKYERVINDGLLARIDALLTSLEAHKAEAEEGKKDADEVDGVVFDALMHVTSDGSLGEDQPPRAPEGVHKGQEQPSYSKMMGALVDQVKTEVDKSKTEGKERYGKYVKEVGGHQAKVQGLQKDLNVELARLEKEDAGKITSDSIRDGFNTSQVSKEQAAAKASTTPELLNPNVSKPSTAVQPSSAGTASTHRVDDLDEEDMEASPTAKRFGKIPYGDYGASLAFISQHPQIMIEKETDGLLAEAFNAQLNATNTKEQDYARACVHQALLLQYCRQLGKDGVRLFFQRVQTQGHQARKLFLDDVNSTYARIRSRTAELKKQSEEENSGDREQIQLHAVDPNTTINIVTPPALADCENDDERTARQIFDTFSPGLRRALESGSLDKVNEVLGKMSVSEAEEVVEQLGNGGMLSLEEGVIDATTEEGRKQVDEINRQGKMPGQQQQGEEQGRVVEVEEMD